MMDDVSNEVRDRFGRRVIPPAKLPPGAIGWDIYEHEPAPLGQPSHEPPEFIGFIPASAEACCVCGAPEVIYHNYRDLPFCQRCADPPYRTPWKRRLALAIRSLRGVWP